MRRWPHWKRSHTWSGPTCGAIVIIATRLFENVSRYVGNWELDILLTRNLTLSGMLSIKTPIYNSKSIRILNIIICLRVSTSIAADDVAGTDRGSSLTDSFWTHRWACCARVSSGAAFESFRWILAMIVFCSCSCYKKKDERNNGVNANRSLSRPSRQCCQKHKLSSASPSLLASAAKLSGQRQQQCSPNQHLQIMEFHW